MRGPEARAVRCALRSPEMAESPHLVRGSQGFHLPLLMIHVVGVRPYRHHVLVSGRRQNSGRDQECDNCESFPFVCDAHQHVHVQSSIRLTERQVGIALRERIDKEAWNREQAGREGIDVGRGPPALDWIG